MKQNILWNNHSVCVNDTFILIYFNVYKHDEERRNVIREYLTQGMIVDGKRINYVFTVVSLENDTTAIERIKEENEVHGDILISLHEDSRRLIPMTILDTFLWVRDYCKTARYVVKTDGDTWIHLGNLIHYYKSLNESRVFSGSPWRVKTGSKVYYHEVYTIPYDYPGDLVFAHGSGYVLSQDLIPLVNIGVQYLDVLFPASEDIIITHVMNNMGVHLHSQPKGLILVHHCYNGPSFPNNVVFVHPFKDLNTYKEVFHNRSSEYCIPSVQ